MEGRCFTIWATRESKQKQKRLREGNKKTQKNYTKNGLNEPDYHKGVVTHLEPDILECEVKWTLGRITINKAGGGDRISAELFKILKDAAAKVLHSICQKIWETHQCPQVEKHHFSFQSQRIVKSLSCVRLLVTPGTAAYLASPSMGFSRQEYWNVLPLPSPKEGQCQKMFKLCTIVFISHTSKVMLKILQSRLQQYVNLELLLSTNWI